MVGMRRSTSNVDINDNRPCTVDVTIEYIHLFPNNAAILSGKKIYVARFYTISEMQAARNLYSQYVNYQ